MRAPTSRETRWLIIATLLVLWETLPRFGVIPPLFLPPLSTTAYALWANGPEYISHLWVTLREVGVALLFACGGGIAAGIALGTSPALRRLLLPIVSSAYAIPLVVLYPLFTAWFGIGEPSKIVFASVYGFLPTLLGAAAGAQTIDRGMLVTAKSMGATRMQQIVHVLLPATMPTVLTSLRIGGALVIVGVVVAEMLMSTAGIGFLISRYRTLLDSPKVFAAILLVLALAIAFDLLVQAAERRFSQRGSSGTVADPQSEGAK
ncbi:ABC transporter permease [Aureimonas fodinaquatilis]|uniref:ABC transporter permease n=1 Tax=Aureimonas fodinaquatilis TaxID=2565783 RepID=A0A5B0E071_9HYPH|nr:ABC transporter permease [Aureimonas fodinaquatilis]KAA0970879.1 ABC transporter permease [Aureimonas fodinaquatilis]